MVKKLTSQEEDLAFRLGIGVIWLRETRGYNAHGLAEQSGVSLDIIKLLLDVSRNDQHFPYALQKQLAACNTTLDEVIKKFEIVFDVPSGIFFNSTSPTLDAYASQPSAYPYNSAIQVTRWLEDSANQFDTATLIDWLSGRRLPAGVVHAHDNNYHEWVLKGLNNSTSPDHRKYLEKWLAYRLARVVNLVNDRPSRMFQDYHPVIAQLFHTCAGLNGQGFLGEVLWKACQRHLDGTNKLSHEADYALSRAMINNPYPDAESFISALKNGRPILQDRLPARPTGGATVPSAASPYKPE
jgi:hypothetical protein